MSILAKFFAVGLISVAAIMMNIISPPMTSSLKQPKVSTPLTEVELLNVLRDSHVSLLGKEPSDHKLAMAWAQVSFENGRGTAIFNHNIGNIWKGSGNPYYVISPEQKYRSFETFEAGATTYWNTVRGCGPAWSAFEWGTARAVAEALKMCRYYDADVDGYAVAMGSLYYNAKNLIARSKDENKTGAKDGGSD